MQLAMTQCISIPIRYWNVWIMEVAYGWVQIDGL